MKFHEDAPFIDFHWDALKFDPAYFKDVYQGFKDYIVYLKDVVEKKFPVILKKVEAFPQKCEEVKEHAKDEIDALDFMKKGQAVMAMGLSIKGLLNVP